MIALSHGLAHVRWRMTLVVEDWTSRLAAGSPRWLAGLFLGDTRLVVATVEDGQICAELRRFSEDRNPLARATHANGQWGPAGDWEAIRQAAHRRSVVVAAPAEAVLSQVVRLPRVALEDLPSTIRHGLRSWTPFDADEIYVIAVPRPPLGDQVLIDLTYVPKVRVQPLLDCALAAGLSPDRLALGADMCRAVPVDQVRLARLRRAGVLDGILALIALSVVLGAGGALWLRQAAALEGLRAAIRVEADALRRQEDLIRSIEARLRRHRTVQRQRALSPGVAPLIDTLLAALPPQARLTSLDLAAGRGQIGIRIPHSVDTQSMLARLPGLESLNVDGRYGLSGDMQDVLLTFVTTGDRNGAASAP